MLHTKAAVIQGTCTVCVQKSGNMVSNIVCKTLLYCFLLEEYVWCCFKIWPKWGSIILLPTFWNSLHVGSAYGAYVGSSPGFGREPCCHVIVARSFTLQEKTLICLIVSGIKILSKAQQHSLDNVGICLDTVTLYSLNWGQKCAGHSRQWILLLYSVIGCSTSVRIDDSSRFFVYRAGADTIKPGLPEWTLLFKHLYSMLHCLFIFFKDICQKINVGDWI